jgi:hypothetical protein
MDKENVAHMQNGVLFTNEEDEITSFAGKWMELEIIMLREISQAQKDKYHMQTLDLK